MPRLTGTQTGTNGADEFIGNASLTGEAGPTTAGIFDAIISAKGGNDTITGEGTVTLSGVGAAGGIGIRKSQVYAGSGDDTITATGLGDGLSFGQGIGNGLIDSEVYGGSGKDTFTVLGRGTSTLSALSWGLNDSLINSGIDDDTIKITAEVTGAGLPNGLSTGLDNSSVKAGRGNDSIEIEALSILEFFPSRGKEATARGLKGESVVNGGLDNDTIDIVTKTRGDEVSSTGLEASSVYGAAGNDVATIATDAVGISAAEAVGITQGSLFTGGAGADVLKVVTKGFAGGPVSGATATVTGVKESTVAGGADDDVITLETTSQGNTGTAVGVGAEDARIYGGSGNDVIEITTSASGSSGGTANGLVNSTVSGGDGNDDITINTQASGEDQISGRGASAKGSRIYGGVGDDTITVSMSFGRGYSLDDTLIAGGAGNDVIDAGIGNGTIRGGSGTDTAVVDFLDRFVPEDKAFSVAAINGGVEISGSVDQTFFSGDPWTQQIFSVETFKVGETTYTASELVNTFG